MHNNQSHITLGVNIDHIAVLREARKINDPDPLMALAICAQNGADQITIHLREDRRHIHDDDARKIIQNSPLPVNLECSINPEILTIACKLMPHRVTLVPEKREEVTTEGGLDVHAYNNVLSVAITTLQSHNIDVSLFIDPTRSAVEQAMKLGAQWVELHTGSFANLYAMRYTNLPYTHHCIEPLSNLTRNQLDEKLENAFADIVDAANYARTLGLKVAAGHGLNYQNVTKIAKISTIEELNIGQSIIARSIFVGLGSAVREMKNLCHA